MSLVYKRVLLKLSGEALKADEKGLFHYETVDAICEAIGKCRAAGTQVAVVVGAGNIWRGGRADRKMDRSLADHMGMLGTTINALCLKDTLVQMGIPAVVMTAVEMRTFALPYVKDDAVKLLEEGTVVIFGCGTGSPYFSTDTAAVLRGKEIGADALLFAKNIDGIYTADPKKDRTAVKLSHITFKRILSEQLKAIDLTAAAFCLENDMKVLVFGLDDPENIVKIAMGEQQPGTVIDNEE
ncbi:MAG: UMP kinase [Clostridia bacterium]|nr:UMP kinase [Clostridia bacterium]MBQ8399762.1 UMP kinase [Clostridia bacterium]